MTHDPFLFPGAHRLEGWRLGLPDRAAAAGAWLLRRDAPIHAAVWLFQGDPRAGLVQGQRVSLGI